MYYKDFNIVSGTGTIYNDPIISKSWKETDLFIRLQIKENIAEANNKTPLVPIICYIQKNDPIQKQLLKGIPVFYKGKLTNSYKNSGKESTQIEVLADIIRIIQPINNIKQKSDPVDSFVDEQPGIGFEYYFESK